MGDALRRHETDAPAPGTLIAGKYRIRRLIGRGGMGRVLAATNEATGKSVALKWILDESSPRASSRFAREARAAGRIHHPNVIDVYDVVEHEGSTVIVMEELHGETLAARMARGGPVAVDAALSLAIEIGRGIAAAHAAGVIHRDLKPANVFLCEGPDEGVKILDFGISKIAEPEPTDLTDTGVVLGTPQYLAPEQVRSASDVDHRVDVYALGAILYEMLAGRPPHQHAHVPALLVEIATVAPRPLGLLRPDLPASVSELVGRALAKDPDARFPSADALVVAMRRELGTASSTPVEGRASPALEVPTLDAREAPPTAVVRAAPTPTAETRDERPPSLPETRQAPASDEASRARRPAPSALVVFAVIAIAIGLALAWRSASSTAEPALAHPTPPSPALEPAPSGAMPPASRAPSTAGVSLPTRPAEVSVAPRPAPPATRSPSTGRAASRTASAPPPVTAAEVTPTELEPAPAVSDLPPASVAPSTPTPRAGRLGLDDL
ncbi:MAG: protein kinase [Sandaracinus sp.]